MTIHTLNSLQIKLHAWGVVPHPFVASAWSGRRHMGHKGPFSAAAAMAVVVVMPLVFVLLKHVIKILKLIVC